MNSYNDKARALFIAPNGDIYPDYLICSGKLTESHACVYSQDGRIPPPEPLDPSAKNYSSEKGEPGELCPPCVKQQLTSLGHWEGHRGNTYPEDLKPLRLFKCSQWLWLVIPGLFNDNANVITIPKNS
jgi:hypothetical protein